MKHEPKKTGERISEIYRQIEEKERRTSLKLKATRYRHKIVTHERQTLERHTGKRDRDTWPTRQRQKRGKHTRDRKANEKETATKSETKREMQGDEMETDG